MPKARRRLPGGLTGNALFTGVISAIVAGVISFYVAHWQSQDAVRQAIASEQVQEVTQLEADARTFDQDAYSAYLSGWQCAHKITSACKTAEASTVVGSPLISAQDALTADMNNISDSAVRTDAANLLDQVTGALAEEGSENGTAAWWAAGRAYAHLLIRCGQLIKEDD
jgi:ethanolamine ammonia-lyase small subunit